MNVLNRLVDVRPTDPEDARRRKLLNILVLGVAAVTLLAVVVTTISLFFGEDSGPAPEVSALYIGSIVMLASTVIIFFDQPLPIRPACQLDFFDSPHRRCLLQ